MGVLDHLNNFCTRTPSQSNFWPHSCAEQVWSNGTSECSDSVDLPLCFTDTAILYGICIVMWLLAGMEFLCFKHRKPKIAFHRVNVGKLLLLLVIGAASLCDLVYTIYQRTSENSHVTPAEYQYFSPIILTISMVILAILLLFEKVMGVRSSGTNLVFWLGLVVYGTIKTRTLSLIAKDDGKIEDSFRFVTFIVSYIVIVMEFVLAFLPDPKPKYQTGVDQERKPSPHETATFLSRITWFWQDSMLWKGWRRPLKHEDLPDINTCDKSGVVGPKFQKNWNRELRRVGLLPHRDHGSLTPPVQVQVGEYQPLNTSNITEVEIISSTSQSDIRRQSLSSPSLVRTLIKTYGTRFLLSVVLKYSSDLLSFASPLILKLIIDYTTDPEVPAWKGYFYAVLLFLTAELQSVVLHQHWDVVFTLGMTIRSSIIATIYSKALRMSGKARQEKTTGEIVNLMSVDAQRLMDVTTYIYGVYSSPFQIVLALVLLYNVLGPSVFAGFGVMILLIPLNFILSYLGRKYQVLQMQEKDCRIKLVNEILNGMKVIKLYAWEKPFHRLVMDIRGKELAILRKYAFLRACFSFTWTCAPFMVTVVTFMTYALTHLHSEDPDDKLTAAKVFVSLSLFNILRFPLVMLPMMISFLIEASVSIKRLSLYLKGEELDPDSVQWRPEPARNGENSVNMENGSFTWEEEPFLSKINFKVKPGQLVAVVGHVGAGKSSLIQAMLGEMQKVAGTVAIKGNIAYVPQQAWIQNATVRDNILFGKEYDQALYNKILDVCALKTDLEILPAGDLTEIGEKGINLSGGQKQRVSLARAVYQDADIYLLDDPLSAVDAHVGKHIFEYVIGPDGILKNKSRVLVTHGIGFLPQCGLVVSIDEGSIMEEGTYDELMERNGTFAEFIRVFTNTEENEEDNPSAFEYDEYEDDEDVEAGLIGDTVENNPSMDVKKYKIKRMRSHDSLRSPTPTEIRRRKSSKSDLSRQLSKQKSVTSIKGGEEMSPQRNILIHEEKVEVGGVKLTVFVTYLKAATYFMAFLLLIFYTLSNVASVGSNFWLADYSNKQDSNNSSSTSVGVFLGVYGTLGVLQAIFICIGSFSLAFGSIFASSTLHDQMLFNILRSPMAFFDTTPLGRILNRFSKDIYTIDEAIPMSLRMFILTTLSVISTIIVICIATPIFIIVILPLSFLYVLVQRFYIATSRQLKRLDSITRSPIYTHFQESVSGAATIRAYRKQHKFILESERRVDYNQMAYYPNVCANRWLGIRLEFVGNLVILFTALFAAIQRNYGEDLHLSITAGMVGLSISYALQITGTLNWMVRQTSELETNVVAVERTKEYSETENEAPAIIPENRPAPGWPDRGHVTFNNYSTRYRADLDLVLRDIKADFPSGTKVGIVGRTGAGKSSLTLALFRIIEPANGSILIDGCDISQFGLEDLRSKITIIPQDPVLFSGDLRMNLDPFETYSDDKVWLALRNAHLSTFVGGLTKGLQHNIAEGGENLSVGQRQLVCLARALLRKTKILVLDEATAAVDLETDQLIQNTIKAEFVDCTVITIAHRLNTIMDYDIIMVLDAGRVVEFESPRELLSNKSSTFYSMAKDAGLAN